MATPTPQPGQSRSESSRSTGALSPASFAGTQQSRRQQLVHRDAANAASVKLKQDAHLIIVCMARSSKYPWQHAIGYEYNHIMENGFRLTVKGMVAIPTELRDQFIAASNRNPPWSSKPFVHTVCKIEHHDVVSSGILEHKFCDKGPQKRTKHALNTLEEGAEVYIVDSSRMSLLDAATNFL